MSSPPFHGRPPLTQRSMLLSAEASAVVKSLGKALRSNWFGSLKGSGFARLKHFFSSLVGCCSEAFVATRVAESFIMFYLVPKFDKTSFTFHLE